MNNFELKQNNLVMYENASSESKLISKYILKFLNFKFKE